jgi:hypothetical protein
MTAQEWHDFIGRLDAHDRVLVQSALGRMETVLEHFRSNILTDTQRLEREITTLKRQVRELRDRIEAGG